MEKEDVLAHARPNRAVRRRATREVQKQEKKARNLIAQGPKAVLAYQRGRR